MKLEITLLNVDPQYINATWILYAKADAKGDVFLVHQGAIRSLGCRTDQGDLV